MATKKTVSKGKRTVERAINDAKHGVTTATRVAFEEKLKETLRKRSTRVATRRLMFTIADPDSPMHKSYTEKGREATAQEVEELIGGTYYNKNVSSKLKTVLRVNMGRLGFLAPFGKEFRFILPTPEDYELEQINELRAHLEIEALVRVHKMPKRVVGMPIKKLRGENEEQATARMEDEASRRAGTVTLMEKANEKMKKCYMRVLKTLEVIKQEAMLDLSDPSKWPSLPENAMERFLSEPSIINQVENFWDWDSIYHTAANQVGLNPPYDKAYVKNPPKTIGVLPKEEGEKALTVDATVLVMLLERFRLSGDGRKRWMILTRIPDSVVEHQAIIEALDAESKTGSDTRVRKARNDHMKSSDKHFHLRLRW